MKDAGRQRHGQHVTRRQRIIEDELKGFAHALRADRPAMFAAQRFGYAQQAPCGESNAHDGRCDEDPMPGRDEQEGLPQRRSDDGHRQQYRGGVRHYARHRRSRVAVPNHGHRSHACRRCPCALQETHGEHAFHRCGERGEHTEYGITERADQQQRLASVAIGKRTVCELRAAESEQVCGDDPLPVIVDRQIQCCIDLRQGGQDGTDGQGAQRHLRGHQYDQFPVANLSTGVIHVAPMLEAIRLSPMSSRPRLVRLPRKFRK